MPMTTTGATAMPMTTTGATATTTLNATKPRNIDLFQVFIGQINKLNKLLGEFFLLYLTVTIVRIHNCFPFFVKHAFIC